MSNNYIFFGSMKFLLALSFGGRWLLRRNKSAVCASSKGRFRSGAGSLRTVAPRSWRIQAFYTNEERIVCAYGDGSQRTARSHSGDKQINRGRKKKRKETQGEEWPNCHANWGNWKLRCIQQKRLYGRGALVTA